jgi:uncharacterized protein
MTAPIQSNDRSNQEGKRNGGSNRGFASMDPQKQREIAREGGRAAHESGNAHKFTSQAAREAGRKGGAATRTVGPKPAKPAARDGSS